MTERWVKLVKEMPVVRMGGLAEAAVVRFLESHGYKLINWQSKLSNRHDFDLEFEKDSIRFLIEVKGSNCQNLTMSKIDKLLKLGQRENMVPCIAVYRVPTDTVYLFVLKEKGFVGQIRK
jgi:Holliday junction resolvase-like predicted endonuclease